MSCARDHKPCAGYVYVATHPQADESKGYFTKVGFSKDPPAPMVIHSKLGIEVPKPNSRDWAAIAFCNEFGLEKPKFWFVKPHERARCLELIVCENSKKVGPLQPAAGSTREVFNLHPDLVVNVVEQIFSEFVDL